MTKSNNERIIKTKMAEVEYGKLMDKNYKPHIVGTNHLMYNLDATILHIQSLGEIKPVMLEAYDPNDDSPPLTIDLDKVGGNIEIVGIKSNPNDFYRKLVKYFNSRGIEPIFAYSKEDAVSRIEITVESLSPSINIGDLLKKSGEEFSNVINPIILERVLEHKPQLIVIGSAHGEYINKNVPNSSYVFIDDQEKIELYGKNNLEAILDALKRMQ